MLLPLVLLSTAALYSLSYWMLRAWVPPLWALVGGLLAVAEFGPLNPWMNNYWGGALAATAGVTGEVFNVASGVETSLNELAQALLTAMGASLAVEYGPERKVNAVSRRLADPSRARACLGFETRVDLDEGLRRLVAWWRRQSGRPALSAAGEGRAGA